MADLIEEIEPDTAIAVKREIVLKAMMGLMENCNNQHDRSMLLLAYDIVGRVELKK